MLMSKTEALFYISGILDERWFSTRTEEAGIVLGEVLPSGRGDEKDELATGDPGAWETWVSSIKKVTDNEMIDDIQAKKAMVELMKQYNNEGFDFQETIDHFQNVLIPSDSR